MFHRSLIGIGVVLVAVLAPDTCVIAQEEAAPIVEETLRVQPQSRRGFRGQREGGFRSGRRMGGRFMGMVPLLQIDSVKQELKLEGDQAAQVESLTVRIREDFAEQLRELMQALRESGPEDRQQLREKLSEVTGQINERLTAVLNPEQMGRLKQIDLQLGLRHGGGAAALTSKDLATALDLTSEQQQLLRQQAIEARNQSDRQPPTLAEARAEVSQILTPEQQEKLDNLLGTEFDLPAALLDRGPPPGERRFRRSPSTDTTENQQPSADSPAE